MDLKSEYRSRYRRCYISFGCGIPYIFIFLKKTLVFILLSVKRKNVENEIKSEISQENVLAWRRAKGKINLRPRKKLKQPGSSERKTNLRKRRKNVNYKTQKESNGSNGSTPTDSNDSESSIPEYNSSGSDEEGSSASDCVIVHTGWSRSMTIFGMFDPN